MYTLYTVIYILLQRAFQTLNHLSFCIYVYTNTCVSCCICVCVRNRKWAWLAGDRTTNWGINFIVSYTYKKSGNILTIITFLQIHIIHFRILNLLQFLAKLFRYLFALIIRFDFLFGAWYTKAYATADHYHCKRQG